MKTQTVILVGIIVFAVIISFFGFQMIDTTKIASTINAQGTSELTFSPDIARVYAGVSILKPNAKDAQAEENRIIALIIKDLKAKGISESDIETDSINLYEDKSYSQFGDKSNGWRATQTLKVKTKDFSKVGTIVDIAINNGANQINSIEFYLSPEKEKDYKQQAIADATKNAKDKAVTMATSLGQKLGKVISVSESNYNYMPYNYMMKNNVGVDAVSESATVMPKDVTVQANIMVVYEVK